MSDARFFVTGASGWLGRRVVRALIQGHAEMGAVGAGGRKVRMLVAPGEACNDLKALGANRKVRQAESDFQTAKNLHDNGLISDEMFEKRKTELKEALSANKVFQD
mgnify:CR=1 FL=1